MSDNRSSIAGKSVWTIGAYAGSAGIRFATNIVLSQLLGPAILGIVVIAQAVRTGTELLTDLGIEQNVVHSRHGDDPVFLDTAWTMQVARGLIIALAFACLSPLLAAIYEVDVAVLLAISVAPLLNSLQSTSLYGLARRLDVKTRNLFEIVAETAGLVINVVLAVTLQNVWAPILGILLAVGLRSALTYALPHRRPRVRFDRIHARDIFHFSKWIMLSSLALYAAVYVDRLYLGLVVSLAVLGVYGVARAIADLPTAVAGRLGFQIVFPFVARQQDGIGAGTAAREELGNARRNFLILAMIGIALALSSSDWAVLLLYGARFQDAGWMVSILLVGTWISVIASLNEATVFGRGKPRNVSFANLTRFLIMAALLPVGYSLFGLPGALMALPAAECGRYLLLLPTQLREGTTFLKQDVILSLGLALLVGVLVAIRLAMGLGLPWALMPLG